MLKITSLNEANLEILLIFFGDFEEGEEAMVTWKWL